MAINAIDMSNWTEIPTKSQLECLKQQGVKKAIVGASYGLGGGEPNGYGRKQLIACRDAGLSIDIYTWISFNDNWKNLIDRALNEASGLELECVWLDAEGAVGNLSQGQVVQRIRDAIKYTEARTNAVVGIYTGGWWWKPNTGNYTGEDICSRPLWYAAYTQYHESRWEAGEAFGGWKKANVWMKQFSANGLCGLNLDLNSFCEGYNMAFVTQEKFTEAVGALLRLGIVQGDQIKALALGLAAHVQNHTDVATNQDADKFMAIAEEIKAHLADLDARIKRAAELLGE